MCSNIFLLAVLVANGQEIFVVYECVCPSPEFTHVDNFLYVFCVVNVGNFVEFEWTSSSS